MRGPGEGYSEVIIRLFVGRDADGSAQRANAHRRREMMALAFVSSPERCGADFRRPLHDDEAGALKVLHKPPGDDLRHDLVGVVDALPALNRSIKAGSRLAPICVQASSHLLCIRVISNSAREFRAALFACRAIMVSRIIAVPSKPMT